MGAAAFSFPLETSVSGSEEDREALVFIDNPNYHAVLFPLFIQNHCLNPTMSGISEVFREDKTGLIVLDNGRPTAASLCK